MRVPVLLLALAMCLPAESRDLPKIIAHRGASHAAPENTLAAFRLAWEEGADGIEGDFRLTADGEVVCIHDEDTKRTAGRQLKVAASTWEALSALDVGRWKDDRFAGERIPRLEDVLDALPPEKFLFIEIKSGPAIVEPIGRILASRKADPRFVILIAFDPAVVARCRSEVPKYEAHWICALKDYDRAEARESYLTTLESSGATGLQFHCKAPADAGWIARVKAPGRRVASWTVDDAATARRVIAAGADFLTTNRPAGLRDELAEGGG